MPQTSLAMLQDLHTGSTGGVALAQAFFANVTQSDGGAGAMNLEVNAKFHGMQRALTEAIDLNAFLEYSPASTSGEALYRLKGRAGSFCMERSGYSDSNYNQGLSFYSADRLWLQPGGWVHRMINDAWQPWIARVALSGGTQPAAPSQCGLYGEVCQPKWVEKQHPEIADPTFCCRLSVSASFSNDRTRVSLRFVNPSNVTSSRLTVELSDESGRRAEAVGWTIINVSQMTHGGDLTDAK